MVNYSLIYLLNLNSTMSTASATYALSTSMVYKLRLRTINKRTKRREESTRIGHDIFYGVGLITDSLTE